MRSRLRLVPALLLLVTSPSGAATSEWSTMIAPAEVFQTAGVPPSPDPTLTLLALIRALHGPADPRQEGDSGLQSAVAAALGDDSRNHVTLPLPLPAATFDDLFRDGPAAPHAFFRALLSERRAALLYYGAMSLDAGTRAYLAARPGLTRALGRDRAGIVAAFGRSVRVSGGRLIVPGGDAATPLWEEIVGERVTDPEAFIRRLWTARDGRLAYMFDVIAHLDPPRQRFVLGLWIPNARERIDRLRIVQRAFTDIDREWSFADSPFGRPRHDAALLLRLVPVDDSGVPRAPAWRALWEAAFNADDLPDNPRKEFRRLDRDGVMDAAALLEQIVLPPPPIRRQRFDMYAFGIRRFSNVDTVTGPDVVTALRAFVRYPALLLALERMGVASPAVYVSVARVAERLQSISHVRRGITALAQFQGVLAVIGRAARAGRLDTAGLETLVTSLARIEVEDEGYGGRFAAWIDSTLLPALSSSLGGAGGSEHILLTAMADRSPDGDGKRFEWEGLSYVVDVTAGDRSRFEQVRRRQGGNHLDDVLALARAARASKFDVARLQTPAAGLQPPRPWFDTRDSAPDLAGGVARAAREGKSNATLVEAIDHLLAEVLLGIVYAPHQGDPGDLFPAAADLFHRHDFGLARSGLTLGARRRAPWERPRFSDAVGQQLRVSGSLLGLDLAMSRYTLRRLATDRMPERPRLNQSDRDVVMDTASQLNPRDLTDARMHALVDALTRGRARIAAARADAGALDLLAAAAGVSEVRRQVLSWMAARQAERIENLFTLAEVLRLGGGETADLDPWGMANEPLSACFCLAYPDAVPWEHFSGRPGSGQIAARLPDLTLRLAELFVAIGVPAALLPATFAYAAQDFVDEAPALDTDDGGALVERARALTRLRVEDYLAAVAARGPLRPETRP